MLTAYSARVCIRRHWSGLDSMTIQSFFGRPSHVHHYVVTIEISGIFWGKQALVNHRTIAGLSTSLLSAGHITP